ncbi:Mor transcription activator family protein [Levilactobacillus sp. HBUAS70063]|uniref:Mor transcription activator family protein n=1 Tax=Levilactobacillus sp. HBUAS70063 TaxID=3109359 RepID=UPI003132D0CB
MAERIELEALHQFYKSLNNLVGTESMLVIYEHYKGTQLNFPIHLYDRKVTAQRVLKEFDGHNQHELARKYGYSQKWIQMVVREAKEDK